jgi:Uma2 family endonuclease
MSAQPSFEALTYSDYMRLPDDGKRYELIHGEIIAMAGAGRRHQRIVAALSAQLVEKLRNQRCESFIAPFDVRLPHPDQSANDATNVVQPDLLVYCDPKKHDERGGVGAPDFVIEVLSPGSGGHDHVRKLRLYESFGVKEYWIVDGANRLVLVYLRDGDGFAPVESFNFDGEAPVQSVAGLSLDFAAVALELDRETPV